jgi:hypothetical protein
MGHKPLTERFWAKLRADSPDVCWPWPGGKLTSGYGLIRSHGRAHLAHRVSWELHNDQRIPDGMVILHSCDTPQCVNPNHLSVGFKADNSADMISKGRQARGRRVATAVLTETQVAEIRTRNASGASTRTLASEYGVSQTAITNVTSGKTWKMVA